MEAADPLAILKLGPCAPKLQQGSEQCRPLRSRGVQAVSPGQRLCARHRRRPVRGRRDRDGPAAGEEEEAPFSSGSCRNRS